MKLYSVLFFLTYFLTGFLSGTIVHLFTNQYLTLLEQFLLSVPLTIFLCLTINKLIEKHNKGE